MLPALWNTQIDEWFQREPYKSSYLGCFSKDELKKVPPQAKFGVVNNADEAKKGTHWTCFYACRNQPSVIFFDSEGAPPAEDILHYLQKVAKTFKRSSIVCNGTQYQPLGTDSCGWFCRFILERLFAGHTLQSIVDQFSLDPRRNENALASHFESEIHSQEHADRIEHEHHDRNHIPSSSSSSSAGCSPPPSSALPRRGRKRSAKDSTPSPWSIMEAAQRSAHVPRSDQLPGGRVTSPSSPTRSRKRNRKSSPSSKTKRCRSMPRKPRN